MITKPVINSTLVLIILIAVFIAIYVLKLIRKDKLWVKIFAIFRWLMILGLIFLINLRPMKKDYKAEVEMKNLDVLFVVDSTISMWAEDMETKSAKRMDSVKEDIKYIMTELEGSNFALIKFDNNSQILAPFTMDSRNVLDAIDTIKIPDRYYANGSSMNVPYDDMERLLTSSSEKKQRKTILFFMSDGEITNGSTLKDYSPFRSLIDAGAVLGYGTEEGGKMRYTDYNNYIIDPTTNKEALSVIDEENLNTLSEEMGIDYIHMTDTYKVTYLLAAIKSGSVITVEETDDMVSYDDVYHYFCIPLLILLLLELVIFVRRGRL